ncbi:hypothetical protein [Paenibacillus sinopodophylli]|uniref:glycan biosynthesis hexose transferase WsfD n=1 Tax=Paenibacillus sinopodophylli TaxID=1837342 RepID=UPI001BB12A85|nr:hypothetical protein [Paenibacillus sinopodophylli]
MSVIDTQNLSTINRRWAALQRWFSPAVLASLGVLIITSLALFVSPYIGMADNGDYFRILYSNGLYFNAPDYDSQYLGHFVKNYGIFQYYNENGATLSSSQSLFIRLSIWINQWFNSNQFDIRIQAALFTLLYTGAIFLLTESLTWKLKAKQGYMIAGITIFIFGDTAYTAFFNSFFSESIVLISMIYLFASVLLLYRHRFNDYVLMGIFLISGLLLTTSKQQNAPAGIVIAVTGILLIFVRKQKSFRVFAASSLVCLFAAGIATYAFIPQQFVNINKYHAMTRGVLLQSEDPEAALKSFGIDQQFAVLGKSIYYEPYTTIDVDSDLLQKQFYSKYGFGQIVAYYAAHPDQAGKMLDLAAKNAFTIRPEAMGNYEKSEGKAFGAQTSFFTAYSDIKKMLAPKTFGFIVIWTIIIIGLYLPSFINAWRDKDRRRMLRLPHMVSMIAMGFSGILVSIIGAGDADLSKHEFLFTLAFDIVTFATAADAIQGNLWRSEKRQPSVTLSHSA